MEMVSDRDGQTECGREVLSGTTVQYRGHVVGGMVRVILPDGNSVVMHPHCFKELR